MTNSDALAENQNDSLKSTVNDSVITAKVKSQFVTNNNTKASSINVETHGGVVKLTGIVDSEPEAITAIQIAASTAGVKSVNTNNLHVNSDTGSSEQPVLDSYITAKIKGSFIRENLINNEDFPAGQIIVETKNGIVYLSGEVKNENQIKKAIEISKSIENVHKVISKLHVAAK